MSSAIREGGQLDIEAAFVHAAPSGNNVECGTSCRARAAAEKGISRQLRMLIPTPRFNRFKKPTMVMCCLSSETFRKEH